MINNRQNGRRRGRGGGGGGGPRPPSSAPNIGNRQDNRSRGNASQLHEKYKALARDAQMQGDRVQSEYYLQFADHYYRVLGETRGRFEEQRRPRDDYSEDDEDQDEGLNEDRDEQSERNDRQDRNQRSDRGDRPQRQDRTEREERSERADRPERMDRPERVERADRPERAERPDREDRQAETNGRARQPRRRPRDEDEGDAQEERISLEVLPPAIASEGEEVRAPRRRTRRPRPDEEIAPAA